ncbi:protein NO VEIN domain-containing protein [Sorangium sp. So ce1014]|uniref:protein NO VEIN domain-containing protein n=1 Tax=Sorangium sp. So ce1014 TaxID=3133326 RepID=UPI003F62E1EC
MGLSIKLIGRGIRTNQVHQPVLDAAQIAQLTVSPKDEPFDGDAQRFRLGVEAQRLGLAYEYDPYFALSIARIDPLPHQLEAVYEYFLKLPRIRFLLADDPGAGKTIMAGLLLKELKIRGLVKRTLIVTPANLTFQWERELRDKFREKFRVVKSELLRSGYGSNPWQENDQVITSVSWISRVEDAKESLLRAPRWDLVIVDEAHKMSPTFADKPTLAFQLGAVLSSMADHLLLMTATPHKGDPDHFRRFLTLLDPDVYADVASLREAMRRKSAPFYLRRVKEALVTFPDPDTGHAKKLFVDRDVQTAAFELNDDESGFYDALTRYVVDQSANAATEDSPAARAMGFTMAMLQRRFASSVFAARRSLERMRERRQKILDDPGKFKKAQIEKSLPDDFDELPEEDQQKILDDLESVVVSYDPAQLRSEIQELGALIDEARRLQVREVESKLGKLREVLKNWGIFDDPKMKLLIFTEHKDTLDYLAGDGKENRPKGKLQEWGLKVAQIHGGMKVGDRDTPGTRIHAEREFRQTAQVLVATEAAGEGINLQFCWLMINYDIPWNPVRLEQRMGRIHRYGQTHPCVVFNFVAQNTAEGRVLRTLLTRLKQIKEDLDSDKVFDVVGEVFPSNLLEKLFRDLYARKIGEKDINDRVLTELDPRRFKQITESTLEGLARRELNLSAILGKTAEAKERRLVPEVIEDFALHAGPVVGLPFRAEKQGAHVFRVGKVPKPLLVRGPALEPRFGALAREYGRIAFDKELLKGDPTLDWVTPGHPLFEATRAEVIDKVADDLRRGAVFHDLHSAEPYRLDVIAASIKDGRANVLHRRLFVVRADRAGLSIRQPTIFLDLIPAPRGTHAPTALALLPPFEIPDRAVVEAVLLTEALKPWIEATRGERERETNRVRAHVEISLNELINRAQVQLGDYQERLADGDGVSGLQGLIAQAEQHVEELNQRLESRLKQLDMERLCTIADIEFVGRAWVRPHPDRDQPTIAPMVRDEEIERIAVQQAIRYEQARGWVVESVETENKGFDLISRKPHPHDAKTFTMVRFIEVKGRAGIGEVGLSANEYRTAQRLGEDYWLYVVFNCAEKPELHPVQDPARLGWKPVVRVEHYHAMPQTILAGETKDERNAGEMKESK